MDSFSSFIDQSLVDNNTPTDSAADKASNMTSGNDYSSELFYQLLLSAVSSPNQPDSLTTINPNSLTATESATMDDNSGFVADLASGMAGDPNAFLTAALLSALDPLTSSTTDGANNTLMHGDSAMLIDTPESDAGKAEANKAPIGKAPAAAAIRPVAATTASKSAVALKKQTIQQQALSTTASKRSGNINTSAAAAAASSAVGTAQKTQAATARRSTTPAVSSSSSSVSATKGSVATAATTAAAVSEEVNDDIEMEGIDLKSLSSKERRQLRNKISARNFRVRRK
ncbi:hypothetical protein J3B02_006120, partial [Coemansia erecta]